MNLQYFMFVVQPWLTTATVAALTVSAIVTHRRQRAVWSALYLAACVFAVCAVVGHAGSNALATETAIPDGGVRIDFHPAFRWIALGTQTFATSLAIAGSAALVLARRGLPETIEPDHTDR